MARLPSFDGGLRQAEVHRMALEFRLAEFGHAFATRERGQELREEVLRRLGQEDVVTLDFSGVTNVTYSFADELVGKLGAGAHPRVEQVNMAPAVARTVERALDRRTGALSC
jgi:hypothetical protein